VLLEIDRFHGFHLRSQKIRTRIMPARSEYIQGRPRSVRMAGVAGEVCAARGFPRRRAPL
jgi:hypothetical protein